MFLLAIYPIKHASNVMGGEPPKKRRIWTIALSAFSLALTIAIGIYVWPPLPYYQTLASRTREDFMNVLKSQREPKETLIVKCPTSSEELCTIATNYLEMFQRAGWRTPTGGIERGYYMKSFPGVTISKRPEPGTVDPNDPVHGLWIFQSPSMVTIQNAFHAVDIIPRQQADQQLPSNVITIYFGPPPEPEH